MFCVELKNELSTSIYLFDHWKKGYARRTLVLAIALIRNHTCLTFD